MKRFSPGIMYMLMATIVIAFMQALVKTASGVPVIQIVFIRSAFSLLITFFIIKANHISFRVQSPSLMGLRGFLGLGSLVTFFYTLHHIPLATAITIGNLAPLFLGLLAGYFLKERISFLQWVGLCVAFLGVLLIKGFDSRVDGLDAMIALLSAFLTASAHLSLRFLKEENTALVLFYFSLVVVLALGPLLLWQWTAPSAFEWCILVLIGILSHLGQWGLTTALKHSQINQLISFYYLGFFLSLLLGYTFFEESFNLMSVAGMAVILSGMILSQISKKL